MNHDPLLGDGREHAGCLGVLVSAVSVALVVIVGALSLHSCELEPLPASSGHSVPATSRASTSLAIEITTTTSSSTTTLPVPPPSSRVVKPEPASRSRSTTGDLGVFRVTCYGPPMFPAGQRTASGDPVGPGSIAVDPAVIRLGTRLEVSGYGRGVANDTGSKVKGHHVDVWVADPTPCPWSSGRVRVVA